MLFLERSGGMPMIDYSPFWETLKNSSENWYTLTNKHHLSHSTLHRLKHNKDISMKTVNDLCRILHCNISDIARYVPSEDDQLLWFFQMSKKVWFFLSGRSDFLHQLFINPLTSGHNLHTLILYTELILKEGSGYSAMNSCSSSPNNNFIYHR